MGLQTSPVHVLDLGALLPLAALAGIWLWRGRSRGAGDAAGLSARSGDRDGWGSSFRCRVNEIEYDQMEPLKEDGSMSPGALE